MQKYKNTLLTTILVSEASHVFCCVLPTVFSLVSLMSGIGLISAMPVGWIAVHDTLHHWEVPMIVFSAFVLLAGWGLHWYTEHLTRDGQHTNCCHDVCKPRENKVHMVLKIATVLFFLNVLVYGVFHAGMVIGISS